MSHIAPYPGKEPPALVLVANCLFQSPRRAPDVAGIRQPVVHFRGLNKEDLKSREGVCPISPESPGKGTEQAPSPHRGSNSPLPIPLICTGGRWNPATCGANQGRRKRRCATIRRAGGNVARSCVQDMLIDTRCGSAGGTAACATHGWDSGAVPPPSRAPALTQLAVTYTVSAARTKTDTQLFSSLTEMRATPTRAPSRTRPPRAHPLVAAFRVAAEGVGGDAETEKSANMPHGV